MKNPLELGYRMPAEWEEQEAVWFAWPMRDDLWPEVLETVREELAQLYALAAGFQTVRVLCPESAQADLKERICQHGSLERIEFFDYETDDIWCRDFGPIFLLNEDGSEACIADWTYNAWGGKFAEQGKDNAANAWIAEKLGLRRFVSDMILEGGAIETNGQGGLLTTEAVLLNPNRNSEMGKPEIEAALSSMLGLDTIHWFEDGLAGDDTDGHIDNLARFFDPQSILISSTADPADANYEPLEANRERLHSFCDQRGEPLQAVSLPLPVVFDEDGARLAASYANYLVLNGAIIVPTYADPVRDQEALDILANCFPEREVIGFNCSNIIKEGGALHCMTQNQPAVLVK